MQLAKKIKQFMYQADKKAANTVLNTSILYMTKYYA